MSLLSLLAFFAANFMAALSGAFFRPGDWYRTLDKPAWRPPDWLFAPAWAVLYTMIAVSGWLIWLEAGGTSAGRFALIVYGLHLLVNASWSAVFFGLRRPGLAFFDILLLWGSIGLTAIVFYDIRPLAAWLLLPYLAWVSFAALLNFSIWRRNRTTA